MSTVDHVRVAGELEAKLDALVAEREQAQREFDARLDADDGSADAATAVREAQDRVKALSADVGATRASLERRRQLAEQAEIDALLAEKRQGEIAAQADMRADARQFKKLATRATKLVADAVALQRDSDELLARMHVRAMATGMPVAEAERFRWRLRLDSVWSGAWHAAQIAVAGKGSWPALLAHAPVVPWVGDGKSPSAEVFADLIAAIVEQTLDEYAPAHDPVDPLS